MQIIKILVCLFISLQLSAQDDKKKIINLLEKSKESYEKRDVFQLTTLYKLYPTYKETLPKETYGGLLIKKGNEYYTKIGLIETIITKQYEINVNNESKEMSISRIEEDDQIDKNYDLTNFCRNFTSFVLTSTKDTWICTLTAPKVTFVPYSKVIVYINKNDYRITKQVLYSLKTVKYKNSKGKVKTDFPKIEIEFKSINSNIKEVSNKLLPSYYFQLKKNEVFLSKKYQGYKIVE